ncbi:Pentatricopeptide repeat-containing protein [Trichinella pseudospiralis]
MIEAYLRNGCAEEAKALNDEITKTWYPPHHAVLACSPHLAINVNKAGAERNPTECDQLIQRPLSNKYIDDLVVSCDKESEVIKEMECSVA